MNDKPVSILFLIDELSEYGGTEIHLFELAKNLNRNKFIPNIAVLGQDDLKPMFEKADINVTNLNIKKVFGIDGIIGIEKILKEIKRIDAKILITYHTASDILGPLAAGLAGIVNASSRRDMGFTKKPVHIKVQHYINPFVYKILTVSKAVADIVQQTEIVGSEKLWVIYNGVDNQRFVPQKDRQDIRNEFGIKNNEIVIGTVANFSLIKGQQFLVEAALNILPENSNVKFLFVGDGPTKNECQLRAQRYSENIIFAGTRKDVDRILGGLDIFVMPSLHEGLSNAILQAMSAGLPSVVSDGGSNPELIDERTGLIFKSGDSDQLSQCLLTIIDDPIKRKSMGKIARQKVMKDFTWEKMHKEYEMAFNSLMQLPKISKKLSFNIVKNILARPVKSYKSLVTYVKKNIKSEPIILGYHRILPQFDFYDYELVTSEAIFEKQLEVINDYWEVWPLEQLAEAVLKGEKPSALSITFDDGYADNYLYGLPILEQYKSPATIFITTSSINNKNPLWQDVIAYITLNHLREQRFIDLLGEYDRDIGKQYNFRTPFYNDAALTIVRRAVESNKKERVNFFNSLVKEFGIPDNLPECMTEDMVKDLANHGIKAGSHTVNHEILNQLSKEEQFYELKESKEKLESILNYKINTIAYPCGEYSDETIELLKQMDYKFAVTITSKKNNDPYKLPRIMVSEMTSRGINALFSADLFISELTGTLDKARHLKEKFL